MLARFRAVLTQPLYVRADTALKSQEVTLNNQRIVVQPPYQTIFDFGAPIRAAQSMLAALQGLAPQTPPRVNELVRLGGVPVVELNAMELAVIREDFDRRRLGGDDPPIQFLFEVANSVILRLRSVLQAPKLKPVSAETTFWRLDYLTDDGNALEPDPEQKLIRSRYAGARSFNTSVLNPLTWSVVESLSPTFVPAVWDALLLDAFETLPEIGPALVLGAAALETLVGNALDILARSVVQPATLWSWVNNRRDYRQEPSVEQQYDELLKILSGRSLKDERDLWQNFKDLKGARNRFVHEGVARIGNAPVSVEGAQQLLESAEKIVQWIEQCLPPESRRPRSDEVFRLEYSWAL